jgi:transposase-like protein
LKERHPGLSAAELCRKHGVSDATFYKWRAKYGGMDVSDALKLKAQEEENAKLKRLLAEQVMDVSTLREMLAKKLLTHGSRRAAVDWAINEKSFTQRKACHLVGLQPKTYRYQSTRSDDAGVRQRLRELASQRRRFGYRLLYLLLEREGIMLNWKKLYRHNPRGKAHGAQTRRSQEGFGNQSINGASARGQPALELGLYI